MRSFLAAPRARPLAAVYLGGAGWATLSARWAELLRRVFLVDVLTCPHCQGPRRLLAAIFDPDSIARILTNLALPTEPPTIDPARPPPQTAFDW